MRVHVEISKALIERVGLQIDAAADGDVLIHNADILRPRLVTLPTFTPWDTDVLMPTGTAT